VPDLGGDDDVDPEVEQNDEEVVHDDDDTIALPPPTLTKSSTKRKGFCAEFVFCLCRCLGFVSFAIVYVCWPCLSFIALFR
jgi:hypothetical protein